MDYQKIRKRFIPMSETMFFILFSLREENHGYGIMQDVEKITRGRIKLGAGTVYQSLSKLESVGLIQPTQEIERKKQYRITKIGEKILSEEIERIRELFQITEDFR